MAINDGDVQRRTDNPGSQSALRQDNQQRVLAALVSAGPSSQAELSRHTGLSTATISNIVRELAERGLVSTSPSTSSGRRALSVRLSSNGAIAVGVSFSRSHLRLVVTSPDYSVLAEECVDFAPQTPVTEAVDVAAALLPDLCRRHGLADAALLGVGVAVPAPVDRNAGAVLEGSAVPDWAGVRATDLEDRFRSAVYIDNDADLGALAEITWGTHGGAKHLVFVTVSGGIGAGLILGGAPYRGNIGITGEIGHLPVGDPELLCRCGRAGCLETVASTRSMIDLLRPVTGAATSTDDIIGAAQRGEAATLGVVERAGRAIGHALAIVTILVNPGVLVIGGPLVPLGEILLAPIRQSLAAHSIERVTRSTELVFSELGDRGHALGAASLVLQQPGIPLLRW
jgi:predicted NBD/HSP70 family sugar kinase